MTGGVQRMTMSDGAQIAVYRASPVGARKGGLMLPQEIFGITAHIRDACEHHAVEGYEVLAPALFAANAVGFTFSSCRPR